MPTPSSSSAKRVSRGSGIVRRPSSTASKPVSRAGRVVTKRKVASKGPSFGAAVRKYAGIVHS
ncbi:MAG: hypothetical protein ABIO94_05430, partial [Opitutaceae bacterium]